MTTNLTAYKQLVDTIFGVGIATFDVAKPADNSVMAAVCTTNESVQFKDAFSARLQRIAVACRANPDLLPAVKAAVNQMADPSKWGGFYAELAALDFLLDVKETGAQNLKLDVTLPASETLAGEMGMQQANLDCHLKSFDVYLDTKILGDKSGQILDRLIKQVCREKSIKLSIYPSYGVDMSFEDLEKRRETLLDELRRFVDPIKRPEHKQSTIIPSLSYRFAWNPGAYVSHSLYNPTQHARNHHTLLFKHASKFHRLRPTAIVFVHFPWSGEKLWPMDNENVTFYREFTRAFFEDYTRLTDEAKKFDKSFETTILAGDVTKNLSAVIFLEDNSIMSASPSAPDVRMYYSLNKTAINSIQGTPFETYLQRRGPAI